MTRVLVTGGTGFLGSHLLERLCSMADMEVVVLYRGDPDHRFPGVRYIHLDLTDVNQCLSVKNSIGNFDSVIHLAALIPQSSVPLEGLSENISNNLLLTCNLLKLVPGRVKKFIYASTADVYGSPKFLPLTEDHPTEPSTYYAASKLATEHFLKIFFQDQDTSLVIFRISQVYGPGEPVIKAIPRFIDAILSEKSPVVYGDGRDVRDYIYVGDVVDAFLLGLRSPQSGIYNLSGGRGCEIKEMLDLLIRLAGSKVEIEYAPRIKPFTKILLDINRAREVLRWNPHTSIDDGLRMQLAVHRATYGSGALPRGSRR